MKRTQLVSSLFALAFSCGLSACGGDDQGSQQRAMVGSYPASASTNQKAGVSTWNLYRDKSSAQTTMQGVRPDGSVEEEMTFSQGADGMVTMEQRFLGSQGNLIYTTGAIKFDPSHIPTGTGPTFPPPPPTICPGCMDGDLQTAVGLQAQSFKSGVGEADACNEATFNAATSAATTIAAAFALNLPAYVIGLAKFAHDYNAELNACL